MAFPYQKAVINDGPLAYWTLGGGSTADETTGKTLTANGMLLNQVGRYHEGGSLDGVDDRADLGETSTLSYSTGITVEFWFRFLYTSGGYIWGWSDPDGFLFTGASLKLDVPGDTPANLILYDSGGVRLQSSPLTAEAWYHVAVVMDGGSATLYLNGVSDDFSDTFSATAAVGNVQIGRIGPSTGTDPFEGDIDEIAIYDTKLTATQVSDHYAVRDDPEYDGTYQYMRPDSDLATTGWSDQAGGTTNLFANLDEVVADDVDYIKVTP